MTYSVYILTNEAMKLYIGQTNNLEIRMQEHNVTGKGYTAKHRPWRLVWQEEYGSRKDAMARERYLKTGAGRDWIKLNVRLDA